jgi:hypothetical protein
VSSLTWDLPDFSFFGSHEWAFGGLYLIESLSPVGSLSVQPQGVGPHGMACLVSRRLRYARCPLVRAGTGWLRLSPPSSCLGSRAVRRPGGSPPNCSRVCPAA